MAKLGDLYTDFSRIDLDARGGYARVTQVRVLNQSKIPEYCAFKVMRHEIESPSRMDRFEGEIKTIIKITNSLDFPSPITRMFDCGFVEEDLSKLLEKPEKIVENSLSIEKVDPDLEIISAGTDLDAFLKLKASLEKGSRHWLPYLVVELATYENSLLRQIRQQSLDTISNPYLFSAGEIVSMSLQLLDVMEYLHTEHELAYLDWKPEHIYWDSPSQQVKLIDWNVNNKLRQDSERKKFIREDLRLFCGAALYCSLALNDPEDMRRPIGPTPKYKDHTFPSLQRRYYTDDPDFYERGLLFDDQIKLIIKKGLDPSQGFNSPKELRDSLLEYAEKYLNSIEQPKLEVDTEKYQDELPSEAVQNFRRARSYIAAGDFQYAMESLTDAVASARVKGMKYSDAEKLLEIVKNKLASDELKQKARTAVRNKDWERALNFYVQALMKDPTNVINANEVDDVRPVLKAKVDDLKKSGPLKLFKNTRQLRTLADSAKNALSPDNTVLKSIEQQLNQIRFSWLGILLVSIIGMFALLYNNGAFEGFSLMFTPQYTVTSTLTPIILSTLTSTESIPSVPTRTLTQTVTITSTMTPTETPTPTSTEAILGVGYISKYVASAWKEPNNGLLGQLSIRQPLTLLEQRIVSSSAWYRCRWEFNGSVYEGWILGDNITFGTTPTPSP